MTFGLTIHDADGGALTLDTFKKTLREGWADGLKLNHSEDERGKAIIAFAQLAIADGSRQTLWVGNSWDIFNQDCYDVYALAKESAQTWSGLGKPAIEPGVIESGENETTIFRATINDVAYIAHSIEGIYPGPCYRLSWAFQLKGSK